MRGSRPISLLTRLAGAILFAVPLVPVLAIFGTPRGASAVLSPSGWLQGILLFTAAAWVLALLFTPRADAVYRALEGLGRRISPRMALIGGLALLAAWLPWVGWLAFRHRPHLVDSIAQLFQARAFAMGTVKAPPPEPTAFFAVPHVVLDPAGWYAQYPPGHALLLTLGLKIGVAWIVAVVLTLGTYALLVSFARRVYGRSEALVTSLLLLACPFYWVMGVSFMNHVSALFFAALMLYAFERWESGGRAPWIALAAVALGGVFLSRPWDAIAVGAPIAMLGLGIAIRRRDVAGPIMASVAFGAVASLYLAFNAATTGDPFVPGYIELWGESHGLGFHVSPWGDAHTPWTGLRNELIDLSLLDVFLFEWPIPALWPAALFLMAGREVGRWDRRLLVGLLALPIAYFFYWHRDAFLGPRFLYLSVAFAVPLTARAIVVGVRRLRDREIGLPGLFKPANAGLFVLALTGLCLAYAAAYSIPQRMRIYASGLGSMKLDIAAAAEEAGIDRGIVFVTTSWGDRMLAHLYGAGVSADLAEQVYRHADHCQLAEVIDRTRELPVASLEAALRDLMRGPAAPRWRAEISGDPTLRLLPGRPLSAACVNEIEFDRRGFTIYPPHVLANDMPPDQGLVIARDMRARNGELAARHPDLPAYRYRPGGFTPLSR